MKLPRLWYAFVPICIAIVLFIIPFFWFSSGELDLGGDANRLYFYAPWKFITYTASSVVGTEARGIIEPKYYYLPYVGMIGLLSGILGSSTHTVSVLNGLKLAVGYGAIALFVYELLACSAKKSHEATRYIASAFAGLWYVVSFSSIHMAFFWDRALFTHDQLFLNPLMGYLFLRYLLTRRYTYAYTLIFLSVLFATNFGMAAVPSLFAFYPFVIAYIVLYTIYIRKASLPWKHMMGMAVLFVGIHAFHLLGSIVNFLEPGSPTHSVVFQKKAIVDGGVNYFTAVRAHGLAILNILVPSASEKFRLFSIVGPGIVTFGLIFHKRIHRGIFLAVTFFLIIFFLVTANITTFGFEAYKRLFYIPGFSMFRVFFEKWMYVYAYFYALMVGYGLFSILTRLKDRYVKLLSVIVFVCVIASGIPMFSGSLVHQDIRASNGVKGTIVMDPRYEETLLYIRALPDDGKFLVLPLTDFFRQVIVGKNGGAYEGPSTLFHLTDKYGFVGYQGFGYTDNDPAPYAEALLHAAKEKDYDRLLHIFKTLNIRYILHNDDPKAYEEGFVPGSYGLMMQYLPKTQEEYKEFISHFPIREIYTNGSYHIYEIDAASYNPTIFVPKNVYVSETLPHKKEIKDAAFLSSSYCDQEIFFHLCNSVQESYVITEFFSNDPSQYEVVLTRNDVSKNILLVMQHTFHKDWNVYYQDRALGKESHIPINGYANAWYILSEELPKDREITLTIRMDQQRYFSYGMIISIVSFILLCGISIQSLCTYARHS